MSGYPQYPQQPIPAQPYPQQAFPGPPAGNPFSDQALNPYAAPQQAGYYPQVPPKLSPYAGLWRDGNILVMHKLAPLPDICLKSNQPATRRLKRNLYWHHPAVFLALLLNIIVYAVISMIMTKKATIHIALTDQWFAVRQRRMIFAWCLGLLTVALFIGAVSQVDRADWAPVVLIVSLLVGVGAMIYGLLACRLVTPKRMTDDYIWLKGVHPEFLDRLDPWPYQI